MARSVIRRGGQPIERLPRERFSKESQLTGECLHCTDDEGSPGIVKGGRDRETFAPDFRLVICHLCGQRYEISEKDEALFGGVWPV